LPRRFDLGGKTDSEKRRYENAKAERQRFFQVTFAVWFFSRSPLARGLA
jgi:hypothetical protein